MKEGKDKKPKAIALYMSLLTADGHCPVLEKRGFVIWKDFPVMGCSPDGVVSFDYSYEVIIFLQEHSANQYQAFSIDIKDLYYALPQKKYMQTIGGDTPRESTGRILRKMLCHEVGAAFTWYGTKNKRAFSTLQFCQVMCTCLMSHSSGAHRTALHRRMRHVRLVVSVRLHYVRLGLHAARGTGALLHQLHRRKETMQVLALRP
ncbi:hypothetical protein HPB47_024197 [Ixodes persulcatus]|uniref:Uncharacterized protein n=1 Tax=Ixodes persulcatus TaxID=34615 RepID=A0AC60Q511_IXOPE|nr:hypothetical protein HPB47_024197 [Ixodes persulcatus]